MFSKSIGRLKNLSQVHPVRGITDGKKPSDDYGYDLYDFILTHSLNLLVLGIDKSDGFLWCQFLKFIIIL